MLTIQNDRNKIISTNYWASELNSKGLYYISINAGTFRILVPDIYEDLKSEFETGKDIIITTGKEQGSDAVEILFDDHSSDPFRLLVDQQQLDRIPINKDYNKFHSLLMYTKDCKLILSSKVYLRKVKNLPCLKPLPDGRGL